MKKKIVMLLACTMVMGTVPVMASQVEDTTEGFSTDVSFTVDENGDVTDYTVDDEKFFVDDVPLKYLNTSSYTTLTDVNPVGWDTLFITASLDNPGSAYIRVTDKYDNVVSGETSVAAGKTIKTTRLSASKDPYYIDGKAVSTPGNYSFHIESNEI